MAKRFTDSELWSKDWFLELSIKQKLLVKYVFDNCDIAGFLEISFRTLSFVLGEKVTKEDFDGLKQITFINENTIFVEDFIKFQNGVTIEELNPNYSVHKGILKKLNKYNSFLTLKDPYQDLQCNTSNGSLQVKVRVKDKVNTSNLEEERKENLTKEKKLDPLVLVDRVKQEYKSVIGKDCFINQSESDKLMSLYLATDDFFETLNSVLWNLKALQDLWKAPKPVGLGFSPPFSWLLKDNFKNYSDIRNGVYEEQVAKWRREYRLKRSQELAKQLEQEQVCCG